MSTTTPDALALRHHAAQTTLAERVERALASMITLLDDYSQPELERYSAASARLVAGGQQRSARLAAAYLLGLASAPPGSTNLTRALAPMLVRVGSPVTVSPILRARALAADGVEPLLVVERSSSYAADLASNDLAVAQRAGFDEAARGSRSDVVGYRKVPSSDACSWCRDVSGATSGTLRVYRSADRMPFHERDRCAIEPVLKEQP